MHVAQDDELVLLQSTLAQARNGQAGLPRLAEAHEIACRRKLPQTITEIRRHMRRLLPDPDYHTAGGSAAGIGRDLLLGIGAGVAGHYLLKAIEHR